MLTIRCSRCKNKIFKYNKIGNGKIIRCWKDRIRKDYSIKEGNLVQCVCGNIIGIDEGLFIKMKSSSFVYSGTYAHKK